MHYRYELIRERAKALEKESDQIATQQKLAGENIPDTQEANSMLINAIETKLEILKNIE